MGAHGLQRHSISVVSQGSTGFSSQLLPTIRKPDGNVTWMRNGTFGSDVCSGNAPDGTSQALLIARCSRSRAFCTSWWINVVASLSRSHVIADRKSTRLNSSHLGISYA